MNRPLLTLSLGSFMIAAAHYVRSGETGWYFAWVVAGVFLALVARAADRRRANAAQGGEK